MDSSQYLSPEFNPWTLRVKDLRPLLASHGIRASPRDRKADLVRLFNTELRPKLTESLNTNNPKNNNNNTDTIDTIDTIDTTNNPLKRRRLSNVDEPSIPYTRSTPATAEPPVSLQLQPPLKRRKGRKRDAKSRATELTATEDGKTGHLDNGSKVRENANSKGNETTIIRGLFKRDTPVKFEDTEFNDKVIFGDVVPRHISSLTNNRPSEVGDEIAAHSTFIEQDHGLTAKVKQEPVSAPSSPGRLESTPFPPLHQGSLSSNRQDLSSHTPTDLEENSFDSIKNTINAPIVTNDDTSRLALSGPTVDIRDGSFAPQTPRNSSPLTHSESGNPVSCSSLSFDTPTRQTESLLESVSEGVDESALLGDLQHDFELENSKIAQEANVTLQKINAREKFALYRYSFIKLTISWLLFLLLTYVFVLYRHERIKVGFCNVDGSSTPAENIFSLQCVPCPPHATCFSESRLSCHQDYILYAPLFWSLGGILPTFNKCILDSTKIKKINKITKEVLNLLSRRNAEFNCGDANDEIASLSWNQIVEIVDQRLLLDRNDANHDYFWNRVKLLVPSMVNIRETKHGLRSTSLHHLTFRCRLKRFFMTILLRYKIYWLCLSLLLTFLSFVFHRVNQLIRRNEHHHRLVADILKKLQRQAKDNGNGNGNGIQAQKYIPKIHLRDFYLPQLNDLTRDSRKTVWNSVVKEVEQNSNVKVDDIEVNGDIMRVWTWNSGF